MKPPASAQTIDDRFDCDVTVIGAGVSGLTAALLLSEAGHHVIVLEANEIPGGRIRSLRCPGTNVHIADLGPTWVWPEYQPVVAHWLKRLGLETFAQFETGEAVIQMSADNPVMNRRIPGQQDIRRITGGSSAIVDRLVAALPSGSVRTAMNVTGISLQNDSVEISVTASAGFRSRALVVATPLRIAEANIDWEPALDSKLLEQMRAIPTWMASQAKAVAVFDRPFWREEGLSGRIASQIGPLAEAHDHSAEEGAPFALFGFIGWPAHVRNQYRADLEGRIRQQLVQCIGPGAKEIKRFYIEDWAENRHICTPLDQHGPQNHPVVIPDDFRQIHGDGRLAFAVAEVSTQSPGLIDGAFDAGEQAAKNILQSFQADSCLTV